MSDTFCPIPWVFQAARNNGDLRVCCQANVSKNRGIIRDEQGVAYNARDGRLAESRNAPVMKEIRKNMLEGRWSEECGRCRSEEEAGLNSRRQYEQHNWDFQIDDARACTTEGGELDVKKAPTLYFDLRFGNKCNLACRMCGPSDSDRWYEDHVALTGHTTFHDSHGKVELEKMGSKWVDRKKSYQWYNSTKFWEGMEDLRGQLKHVYMAGGEPLLIREHYRFLEKCIETDTAKNMILEYNTNLTILPDAVTGLWQSFREVRVGASIDGCGEVFEYQRYPARWSEVYKNLQKLDELDHPVFSWLACTVTVYNVMHIPEFMRWKAEDSGFQRINSTKARPLISHHVAHKPDHLNIRVLSEPQKKLVRETYKKARESFKSNWEETLAESAVAILNSIEKYMDGASYYDEYHQTLVDYTKGLDQIRNQDGTFFLPGERRAAPTSVSDF